MDTLKIVREIIYGSVNGIPPIQYVRQIKRERRDPAEIITLEEPESRPAPEDNSDKGEEKKKAEDEEENSGRVETKADKPPSKKRVSALVQKVKSDEKKKNDQKSDDKKKNDQKSSQQSPRN